jgi:hypothetical protein
MEPLDFLIGTSSLFLTFQKHSYMAFGLEKIPPKNMLF